MSVEKLSQQMAKDRNEKIRKYLIDNPSKLNSDYAETAKIFRTTPEVVRHQARSVRETVEIPKVEFKIDEEILKRKENGEIKSLKRRLEQTIKDYQALSDAYDISLNLKTQDVSNIEVPEIKENKKYLNEATVIVQISDGHFGKIIQPSTVNGLNEYNPDIARKRMDKLAENTIRLIKKERQDTRIDNVCIVLGGDFIDNSQLHQGGEMTNALSPMEEILFSRELLHKYIKTISEYGEFKKIMIPCIRGNHSRQTKKVIAAIDYRMNYETVLYNILKQDFSDNRFNWLIPDSELQEFEIYEKRFRAFHAHQVRYGGGIGGLTIPLNKYIMRQDQINPCSYNFIHHFHNYSFPTSKSTLNGSICGLDPYAFSLGCDYQPAMQSFQLVDKKRGMTVRIPIMCD